MPVGGNRQGEGGGGENEGGQLFDMGVYNRREWCQM